LSPGGKRVLRRRQTGSGPPLSPETEETPTWNKRDTELKRGELATHDDDDGRRERREESGVDGCLLDPERET
jgi:hypothetical protein